MEGADFTNALLDKTQQMALCKYADGVNPVTGAPPPRRPALPSCPRPGADPENFRRAPHAGVSTRKSLACGSRRGFKAAAPSSPDGPQASDTEKAAFTKTIPAYRQ